MAFASPENTTDGTPPKGGADSGETQSPKRVVSASERERRQRQKEREERRLQRQALLLEQKKKLLLDDEEELKSTKFVCHFDPTERKRREDAEHREWQLNAIRAKRLQQEVEARENRQVIKAHYNDFSQTMRSREAQRKERVDRIRETQRRGRSLPPPSLAKPKNRGNNSSGVGEEEKGAGLVPQRRRAAPRPLSTGSASPVSASVRNQNPKAVPSRFAATPRKRVDQGASKRAENGTVASPALSSSTSPSKASRGPSTRSKGRSARSQSTPPTSARQPSGASSKATRSPQSRTTKSSVSTKSKAVTKQPKEAVSPGAVAKKKGAGLAKRVTTPPLPSPQPSRKPPAKTAGTPAPDTRKANKPPVPPTSSSKPSEMTTGATPSTNQGEAASASPAAPPSPPAEERVSTPDEQTNANKELGRLAALNQVLGSSAKSAVSFAKRAIGSANPKEGSPAAEVPAEAVPDPDPAKAPTPQIEAVPALDPAKTPTKPQIEAVPDPDPAKAPTKPQIEAVPALDPAKAPTKPQIEAVPDPDPAKAPTPQIEPGSEVTEDQQSAEPDAMPDAQGEPPSPESTQEPAEMSIAERIAKLKSGRNRRTSTRS